MVLESTVGMMVLHMRVIGMKIRLKALEHINGWTAEASKEHGLTIIWMELVYTDGQTVVPTRVSIQTTRRMATASTHGPTSASTQAGGSEASSTV